MNWRGFLLCCLVLGTERTPSVDWDWKYEVRNQHEFHAAVISSANSDSIEHDENVIEMRRVTVLLTPILDQNELT